METGRLSSSLWPVSSKPCVSQMTFGFLSIILLFIGHSTSFHVVNNSNWSNVVNLPDQPVAGVGKFFQLVKLVGKSLATLATGQSRILTTFEHLLLLTTLHRKLVDCPACYGLSAPDHTSTKCYSAKWFFYQKTGRQEERGFMVASLVED